MSEKPLPRTLLEATRYFADPEVCVQFVAKFRWPDGPICPACGGTEHSYLTTRRLWKCRACKKQFSVKVGTIFEDSPIPLDKWLCAIWLIANSKNGISSHELGRAVGLTQKSAWFVNHRIRLAMQTGTFAKLDGEVEADEAFVGGSAENMHASKRKQKKTPKGGPKGKAMVAGAIQRTTEDAPSQVRAEVMLDTEWDSPRRFIRDHVEPGTDLYTDSAVHYSPLRGEYKHATVDHHRGEYVRGRVGTNSIENFWTLVKRSIYGTYVQAAPEHLFRYVDERAFAFNLRRLTDLERFRTVLNNVVGRRLTYAELTA